MDRPGYPSSAPGSSQDRIQTLPFLLQPGRQTFYPPTFLFLDYMLKFASAHNIEKKGEVILRKTREGIREELGMTVKTINRTITKLKEDGLIDTRKGKVVMSLEQYRMARDKIGYYVS